MGLFSAVCESRPKVGTFFVLRAWVRSDACRGRHGCVDRVRAVILAIGFVSRGRLREVLHRCVRGERPTMLPRSGEASPAEGIVRW